MSRDEKLHTAVLVAPASERRRLRKAQKEAAARLIAEQRQVEKEASRAKAEAERAQRRTTVYLPSAGEPGPAMLRSPGRFRLPRHQDTSAVLAGQYPFLAEAGLGSAGMFIGQDLYSGSSFVYDPWVLYQRGIITAPNLILAGIVGSGKSSLAKSLYTRSLSLRTPRLRPRPSERRAQRRGRSRGGVFLCGVLSGCGELVGWWGGVEGAVSEYCVEGGDVSVGQGEDGLARAFALVAFALVVRPGGRVRSGGGESREEHGALRRLLPAWEVYSPGIDEPDLGVRGGQAGCGRRVGPRW